MNAMEFGDLTREKGSITNVEYRTIHAVDTLTASAHLRRLRDLGLLEQRGKGNATYYIPTPRLLNPLELGIRAGTPGISDEGAGIKGLPSDFPPLPIELLRELRQMGKRASVEKIQMIIRELCSIAPLKLPELVEVIQRNSNHLRKRYLAKMLERNEIEYVYPESPNHPQQAYRANK